LGPVGVFEHSLGLGVGGIRHHQIARRVDEINAVGGGGVHTIDAGQESQQGRRIGARTDRDQILLRTKKIHLAAGPIRNEYAL